MADNKIPANVLSTTPTERDTRWLAEMPRPSVAARLVARARAGHFDRLIAVGVPAPADGAQAVHEARLRSPAEREAIARSLRRTVADARGRGLLLSSRLPLHVPNITAAADLIEAVAMRLHSPRPVHARGMARLRQILSDGSGPLCRYGRGDLRGRLGAALAAL